MTLQAALKDQFHAGLAMLRECVERCPDDLWSTACPCPPEPDRTIYRHFWRIAFHTVYFTHLYLGQDEAAFEPWPDTREDSKGMWSPPWDLEPYEMPEDTEPYTKQQILEYIAFVDALVDRTVDGLDLEANETGFRWYKNMGKLSHELMNLRHLQGHIGQLSEHLMARGIDPVWVAKKTP